MSCILCESIVLIVLLCTVAGLIKAFIVCCTNSPPVLLAYHLCLNNNIRGHCHNTFLIINLSLQCIVGHRDGAAGYHLHWPHRWCDELVSKSRLQDLCVRSLWCHLQAVGHPWWHVQAVLHRPRVWHQRRQRECWTFSHKYTGGKRNIYHLRILENGNSNNVPFARDINLFLPVLCGLY